MAERTGFTSGLATEFEKPSGDMLPDIPIDDPQQKEDEESFGKLPQPEVPGLQPPGL